ncbi:MAG TPA: DUF1214 domain-containing protein, partial [Pseudoxanthomonas sp.]|nr:DUF1214 domain-containing protein [Pseudoxanthomonas sp.]
AMTTRDPHSAAAVSDQDISDAYIYLLSRLLVLRQQQLDFKEGFRWNELLHRKPGGVDWPNPNLDVAYSEAWVAVDETSCTVVSVPAISGRYYTVQFLNGWGETLANINERLYPDAPAGDFAVCLQGSKVAVPAGARRVDVPVQYSRVLLRVELGPSWDDAVKLQQAFAMKATGTPALPDIPHTPIFDISQMPGAEAFDFADVALDSEADINPGMQPLQEKARAIAVMVQDPAQRQHVDEVIRTQAWPAFFKASKILGHGTVRNGWARPSTVGVYHDDWLTRTLINQGGIWANTMEEVVYYKGSVDSDGENFNGDHVYTLAFPTDALPASFAKYFWSVIAVDSENFRVLPNPKNRFLLNKESKLEYGQDGSLTLYFAADKPADAPDGNWLPTPKGQEYRLTFRFYGPLGGVQDGSYYPPAVIRQS